VTIALGLACKLEQYNNLLSIVHSHSMIPALQYGKSFSNSSVGWSVQLLLPRVCECLLGWLLDAAHHA
jgi:hypothetical protein